MLASLRLAHKRPPPQAQPASLRRPTNSDFATQMSEIQVNGLAMWNAKHGLGGANRRYRRNWRDLRASWEALLADIYERPMQKDSRAFWACVRRAYPDAMADKAQYEGAISHLAIIYGAGSETTVNSISMTMGALACEAQTVQRLEAVRTTPPAPPQRPCTLTRVRGFRSNPPPVVSKYGVTSARAPSAVADPCSTPLWRCMLAS